MIKVFLSTILVIYKAYFRNHKVWKQRPRTHILSEGSTIGWYFEIGQDSGKIPHTCNCLIIDEWILGSGDLKFTR